MAESIDELEKLKKIKEDTAKAEIVIVDDDISFSEMLKDYLLTNADLNSELASNGTDFLKSYKAHDTRKIILDYHFEDNTDGIAILVEIKKRNPHAQVIMVSAQDNLETAIETMRKGATDYFLKTNKTVFANILSSLMKLIEMDRHKLN